MTTTTRPPPSILRFGGGGGSPLGALAAAALNGNGPLPTASLFDALAARFPAFGGSKNGGDAQKQPNQDQKNQQQQRILVSEVEVVGVDGPLRDVASRALRTRPNTTYTLQEVEQDLRRVFATGWFASVTPDAVDTRDGVRLVVRVTANPPLRGVVAEGADALPSKVLRRAFRGLHGKSLNFVRFGRAVERVDRWYSSRGLLGQVTDFSFGEDGVATLSVGEARVGEVRLAFTDPEGKARADPPGAVLRAGGGGGAGGSGGGSGAGEDGGAAAQADAEAAGAEGGGDAKQQDAADNDKAPPPRTRADVVTRHLLAARPGRVYSLRGARQDIDAVFGTGLFEDVSIVPSENSKSTEQRPVLDLTVRLAERKTGGLGAGTGISAQAHGDGAVPGFVGNFSYSQRNFLGLGQRLSALIEVGQQDSVFRMQHVEPWVAGDPHRTTRSVSFLNTRTSGSAVHGRAAGDAPPPPVSAQQQQQGARPPRRPRVLGGGEGGGIGAALRAPWRRLVGGGGGGGGEQQQEQRRRVSSAAASAEPRSHPSSPTAAVAQQQQQPLSAAGDAAAATAAPAPAPAAPPPPPSAAASTGAVVVGRLLGALEFRRPIAEDWTGAAGITWQRARCMDEHGRTVGLDCYGAPLTFSGRDADVAALATLSAAYSSPYDGSSLSLGVDQAVPLQREWLGFTRIRARVDQPVPIRWPLFGGSGGGGEAAQGGDDKAAADAAATKRRRVVRRARAPRPPLAVLHLRGRAGAVRGDLPPYEAFPLGGTNSVRGYADGGVASGRAFVEGTAELRFALKPPLHGVLFVDGGSDLGTGESVVGDPAGARGKPGAGAAAGAGVRIDTPLGPLRLESAWNDKGTRRFHLGIGFD
jgi:hypothetical protein